MNALRTSIARVVVRNELVNPSRRLASTSAVPPMKKYSFKESWLSDPATYPLIVIMGCALTFLTGASVHALTCYKDVQIDPKKRNSKLQTWGQEDTKSVTARVIGWNAYAPEGLGVDHEKWEKEHKEYMKKSS
eukprot:CAMPEP_0197436970 /NCGR_PEP_ID=MMETSP1175-20131217/4292_1 /TAXON_ID=1003142 /ORGANISM="Triceratium dubium, Strain CCMP147" /LENGTH=132 /DNA_ID=CAMNT_0042966377 /DNA_START=213 /DNA_END=611 /DNA_ORIENTATION=-